MRQIAVMFATILACKEAPRSVLRPPDLVGYWIEDDVTDDGNHCGSRGNDERLYLELRAHGRMRLRTWSCDGPRSRRDHGHWEVREQRVVLRFDSGKEETFAFHREGQHLELVSTQGVRYAMHYEFLPVEGGGIRSELVGEWSEGVERTGLDDPRHSVDLCLGADGYAQESWYCIAGSSDWRANDEFLTTDYDSTYRYRVHDRTLTLETSKGEIIELHRTSFHCDRPTDDDGEL